MFQREYTLLEADVVCSVMQTTSVFKREVKDMYPVLKKLTASYGWNYHRLDTVDQKGYPDITLFRRTEYWIMEAKILKKKALVSLEDDLTWQFGQIGFMRKALMRGLNYMLVVGNGKQLAFIKGVHNGERSIDYPDFVRLI